MGTIDCAFVVRVRKRGDRPFLPLDPKPSFETLGFDVGSHRAWTDTTRCVQLDIWSSDQDHSVANSARAGEGVALLVGHRRNHDGRYDFTGPSNDSPDASGDGRHGVYAAVSVGADGSGAVWNDPIGFRCLYFRESVDEYVVGTRAALVALTVEDASKDITHAAWLAALGHWVGESTGFNGVRMLTPGSVVVIDAPYVSTHHRDLPWSHLGHGFVAGGPGDDALYDGTIAELTATVRALADTADRPVLRLTGGRDSRVLLAIALAAGVAHRFDYLTVGPPGLPDVAVASELAARFALSHRVEFLELFDATPFAEQATRFARSTAGMANVFDTRSTTMKAELAITGVCGELLRASEHLPARLGNEAGLEHHFRKDRFNNLGIVDREVFDALHAEMWEAIFSRPDSTGLDPFDLAQRHGVVEKMRLVRLGPSAELAATPTVQPLNSPNAARAAMSLGGQRRQSGVFAAELIRRTCPALVDHRFAGPPWDDVVLAHLAAVRHEPVAPPPPPADATRAAAAAPSDAVAGQSGQPAKQTLMQGLSGGGERVEYLHNAFAERNSPAWSVLDRKATQGALQRYDTLTGGQRKCLFGAATAIAWLDQR